MRGFSTSRGHAAAQCVAISHRIPAQGRAQPCGVVAASDRTLAWLPAVWPAPRHAAGGGALDAAQLAERGAAGEEFVVELCREHLSERYRPDLAAAVSRVSLRSDQLGYDVTSPDTTGHRHRIEVKTTSSASAGRVEFFLSRNEAAVGVRDPGWSLVAVGRNRDGSLQLIGWCSSVNLVPHLPRDVSRQGRWSSVRLSISITDFRPGLPLDAQS
ncbi:DUF3883 domain-containing protein [Ornithinimicrobium murale]|uniref:DUF3883 domain-containing protein n=1 Tax=Ornithinimicrobium murale TaxID=1050153 RepID=UPI003B50DDC0